MYIVIFEDKAKKKDSFKFKTRDEAERKADALSNDDYRVLNIEYLDD